MKFSSHNMTSNTVREIIQYNSYHTKTETEGETDGNAKSETRASKQSGNHSSDNVNLQYILKNHYMTWRPYDIDFVSVQR